MGYSAGTTHAPSNHFYPVEIRPDGLQDTNYDWLRSLELRPTSPVPERARRDGGINSVMDLYKVRWGVAYYDGF